MNQILYHIIFLLFLIINITLSQEFNNILQNMPIESSIYLGDNEWLKIPTDYNQIQLNLNKKMMYNHEDNINNLNNNKKLPNKPLKPIINDNNINDELIFIGISSYRDMRCSSTLVSLFTNAKYPDRLRVGTLFSPFSLFSLSICVCVSLFFCLLL